MLDHVGLQVSDIKRSKEFYLNVLKPLGYELFMEWEEWAGFSIHGQPELWLKQGIQTTPIIHLAFRAQTRKMVDAFYKTALAAGGRDNGSPGVREIYHPNYYAAYILDLDGHNIEAVCREA
ncbi:MULTISPECIES: VOC family protein [Legionella]|uniref:Glyoxalase/bleomycin resistance protein n=1 Tax=Legionella donaldsonii TaxID=45060 RepID=A0A378JEC1_9GAMM|nr:MULTISPECIES: VOC family protein [Legionella]MCC5015709.1 VOC family protein [Legionella sp. 31fI33]STX42970.1 glyoxalase/bleomycin resistance protein [Legionella donaldsonii]